MHEVGSRAGDSHRSFSFVSPNPRPHSEVGVCMDAKHSGLFRPAPQFIIRRCRCEGATPSSPLAMCMHKPAAEPINQSSIHPSISPSVALALALPPFFPSPNSECCHYVLASPQSLFSVSSRRHGRQAGRSAGTDSPGSGRSRVSRISLAAGRGRSAAAVVTCGRLTPPSPSPSPSATA